MVRTMVDHDRQAKLFINTWLLETQNAFNNFENNYGHVAFCHLVENIERRDDQFPFAVNLTYNDICQWLEEKHDTASPRIVSEILKKVIHCMNFEIREFERRKHIIIHKFRSLGAVNGTIVSIYDMLQRKYNITPETVDYWVEHHHKAVNYIQINLQQIFAQTFKEFENWMHVNAHTYYEVYFDKAKSRYNTTSQQTRSQIDAKLLTEYKIQAHQIEDFLARNNQIFARGGSEKNPDQLAVLTLLFESFWN